MPIDDDNNLLLIVFRVLEATRQLAHELRLHNTNRTHRVLLPVTPPDPDVKLIRVSPSASFIASTTKYVIPTPSRIPNARQPLGLRSQKGRRSSALRMGYHLVALRLLA